MVGLTILSQPSINEPLRLLRDKQPYLKSGICHIEQTAPSLVPSPSLKHTIPERENCLLYSPVTRTRLTYPDKLIRSEYD